MRKLSEADPGSIGGFQPARREVVPKSAWRKFHQIGTGNRTCVHVWSSSRLVAQPEALHLGGDDRQFPSLSCSPFLPFFCIDPKLRCIRSTPTASESMSENDLECFANTGVNSPASAMFEHPNTRYP